MDVNLIILLHTC